ATDVEFTRNRIFNATDGLCYHRVVPPAPLGLTLASNTFCSVQGVAVHFEASPPAEGSRGAFTSNLFARTGTPARVDDFSPRPANSRAAWIWFNEVRSAGEPSADQRAFRKTFTVDGSSVTQARLDFAADAAFTVWVNDENVGQGEFLPHLR